jgi:trk system potassium uptake protein TrkH
MTVNAQRDISREEILAQELKDLGLFRGVSETDFDLDRAPSRVEALVMLIRVLGKESEVTGDTWKHPFTDVPGWADNYVGYAYSKGLTNGQSATQFGTGDANAAMFQEPYSRFVIMIFTLLSTISYILYYMIMKGKWREAVRNSEVWSFFSIIGGSTVLIALFLRISGCYSSLWQAVKDSLCQVVSMISTSGYFVCDYMEWPSFTRTLLFLLLFVGGCSASTAGSLKVIRVVIMIKLVFRGIFKRVHPHAVRPITQEGRPISAAMASSVTMHILLFFGVIIMGTVLLSLNNLDMETTFTAVVGIFTNTGLALGQSGTTGYFGMFNEFSQIIMTVLMIAGRLEMYAIILLFTRSFWQPDKAKGI